MKLLKKEEINNILVPHLKPINEKAVHWNRSVLGLLVDTILSPLSWLKSLMGINVSQVKVLAMQWGAEYAVAVQKVLEDEGKINDDESENADDSDDDSIVIDDDMLNDYKQYHIDVVELLKKIKSIHDDTSNNDFALYIPQLQKLNILNSVFDKRYKQIIEFIYADAENKILFEDVIKKHPYDNFKENHDNIEKILTNITKLAKSKDDKTPINELYKLIEKNLKEFINLFTDAKDLVDNKVQKQPSQQQTQQQQPQQQQNASFNNYKYLYNIINEETTIIGNQTNKTPELPDNVKELLDEEVLNTAKQIENIKEKTAKHLNYASLNTIRYSANYIINKNEKERDKAQHAFDKGILDVNNYFQNVIDTNKVMQKATGQVDADIQNQIEGNQNDIDELTNLKITDIKADKEFKLGEIYAFQMNVTTARNKSIKAIMFLTPYTISGQKYNNKISKEEFYTFKYLGTYKFDKDKEEIISWNPFRNIYAGQNIKNDIKSNRISIESISFTGLRPGKTYFCLPTLRKTVGTDKKIFNTVYNNEAINIDDFQKVDLADSKNNKINKTFNNLRSHGTTIRVFITQRFVIKKENYDIYPDLIEGKIDNVVGKNLYENLEKIINHIK